MVFGGRGFEPLLILRAKRRVSLTPSPGAHYPYWVGFVQVAFGDRVRGESCRLRNYPKPEFHVDVVKPIVAVVII